MNVFTPYLKFETNFSVSFSLSVKVSPLTVFPNTKVYP